MSTDKPIWYEPEDPTPTHQCPCCDYVTLPERAGYLICPVCFWEDDGQDLNELHTVSGPNHGLTLWQGRENFRKLGACEQSMVENVCSAQDRDAFEFKPRSV